jgi:23S rRNA pseudouridine2605 synthase
MKIRLNKFIAQSGIASRRASDELIKKGQIFINGKKVTELGTKVDPEKDKICLDDKSISYSQKIYYLVNKPIGYTSTVSDKFAKKLVTELVPKDIPVFPVGRLDKNSRGLMILTNDGELANKITHPRYGHEKEYEVTCEVHSQKISGIIRRFEKGMIDEHERFRPVRVKNIRLTRNILKLNMILKEGKKRQIRRMCEAVGWKVLDLKRVRIGKVVLGELRPGEYKKISKKEIL